MIIKTEENGNQYLVTTDTLGDGAYITFEHIVALKEVVDQIVSDENSRLLSMSLMGDLTCDGCTI